MTVPTWGELARRVLWLCAWRYRSIRRTVRHWRVSRRPVRYASLVAFDLDTRIEPGQPIRVHAPTVVTSVSQNELPNVGCARAMLIEDAAIAFHRRLRDRYYREGWIYDAEAQRYILPNGQSVNIEDLRVNLRGTHG